MSEQEYQQDSEHEEDEATIDIEDHASAYVSFPEAVKLAFKNFFNFSDRSSRSEYWYFTLFIVLILIGATFLAAYAVCGFCHYPTNRIYSLSYCKFIFRCKATS